MMPIDTQVKNLRNGTTVRFTENIGTDIMKGDTGTLIVTTEKLPRGQGETHTYSVAFDDNNTFPLRPEQRVRAVKESPEDAARRKVFANTVAKDVSKGTSLITKGLSKLKDVADKQRAKGPPMSEDEYKEFKRTGVRPTWASRGQSSSGPGSTASAGKQYYTVKTWDPSMKRGPFKTYDEADAEKKRQMGMSNPDEWRIEER